MHHYRSMADRAIVENLVNDRIGIKNLFYVLRPLLACRWIERTQRNSTADGVPKINRYRLGYLRRKELDCDAVGKEERGQRSAKYLAGSIKSGLDSVRT
jgi:predicted nucleotidyltransferase